MLSLVMMNLTETLIAKIIADQAAGTTASSPT
jgi:hypothetical protein